MTVRHMPIRNIRCAWHHNNPFAYVHYAERPVPAGAVRDVRQIVQRARILVDYIAAKGSLLDQSWPQ